MENLLHHHMLYERASRKDIPVTPIPVFVHLQIPIQFEVVPGTPCILE